MVSKNRFRSSPGWLFRFTDSFLILSGIFLGGYIRFWGVTGFSYTGDYLVLRMMLIVVVVQVNFHYFDLYDSKIFRDMEKMGILLVGSLGITFIFMTVIYYLIPSLILGRGIFSISLFLILIFTFSWRVSYSYVRKTWVSKEKILIIGTGDLAKKIKSEILENGLEGFEIVGFIDEDRDKIGQRI
jgi:FlaA1/EpsC-like NDP-sugar epimerase